jgi:predicted Mrr-cat superfamily restriction endonuclease
MSEELKRYVEEALGKWIQKQIEEGNFKANLRIEIDHPIEVKGLKGRIVGNIILSEKESVVEKVPSYSVDPSKKEEEKKKDETAEGQGEEMSLQDVESLLRQLGV